MLAYGAIDWTASYLVMRGPQIGVRGRLDPRIHTALPLTWSRWNGLMDCRVDPRIKSGDGNDEGRKHLTGHGACFPVQPSAAHR